MPLLDHFASPLGDDWPWDGFHGTWAGVIATQLNRDLLPADYYAVPLIKRGGQIEIDVGTFGRDNGDGGVAVATAVWAPPKPVRLGPVEFVGTEVFEIQVVQRAGGPQRRAAIELISPANRDRPATRRAFAVKCASYLQRGVSVIIIDIVTQRTANLHAELLEILALGGEAAWQSPTRLYAVAYRTAAAGEGHELEFWPEALAVGSPLPTLPLWLSEELCLPLRLEDSYTTTRVNLRIPG